MNMMKKNIGFDLDGTLLGSNIIEITSKELGYNFRRCDIKDYSLCNFPNDLREEIFRRFNSPYYMCHSNVVYPYKNVKKVLTSIGKNHRIVLITARNKKIRTETRKLIRKFFPMFNAVHFVNLGESKLPIFKKEKLDVWVDDNAKDCRIASDNNIKTYMICNNDTNYNNNMRNYKSIINLKSIADLKI